MKAGLWVGGVASKKVTSAALRLSRGLQIDRAVGYALLTKAWQLFAVPVTVLLITRYFSPELQGYYYTFFSILALQSFVELGLYLVIVNVASHEWSRLRLGPSGYIEGDPESLSRLVSLGRFIFRWYGFGSVIFAVAVSVIGLYFFSRSPAAGVNWQQPWLTLVILNSLLLWALPFNSLLEGCNQVTAVNRLRLAQVVLENLTFWATLALGFRLWAMVAAMAVKLGRDLYLLLVQYRRFFEPFFGQPPGPQVDWRTEIWPLQWRIAVQAMVNYFMASLFNPVMFHYHGAVVAGRMGMTWQLIGGIQLVAAAWIQVKTPQFGILVADQEFAALDEFWSRVSRISVSVMAVGGTILWMLVWIVDSLQLPVANRLLPPLSTAFLVGSALAMQVIVCQAAYLRAHKREPFLVSGVVTGLASGASIWFFGRRFGPTGAALAYLTVVAGLALPWITAIWIYGRREWHKNPA